MVEEQMNKNQLDKINDDDGNGDKTALLPKRFPFRLNKMLNDAEAHGNGHIVSWMPGGKMFKVHKHKDFANSVMPLYCRHTRYKSFLRQLSMYKFQRVNEGPLRGCYHHPNFIRDKFDLIDKINRNNRCDEDSSVSCSSSPLTKNSQNISGIVSVRKSLEQFLSESDSDSAMTDNNDFESTPAQDSSTPLTPPSNDWKMKKLNEEGSKETLPKATAEMTSSCSIADRTTDPFFDSARKIGYPTGLFDLQDDLSTKSQSQLTCSSFIIEQQSIESQQPNNLPSVGETLILSTFISDLSSQPSHIGDSSDILDEIIKTFKTPAPDSYT